MSGFRRRHRIRAVAVLASGLLLGPSVVGGRDAIPQAPSPPARNARWAVRLERPGLSNFYQVSGGLYRGAQPSAGGLAELARMGIKTVVSLRAFHSERTAVTSLGLGYEHIRFKTWHPEDEDLRRFLRMATATPRLPVFVHCKRGADRTGLVVAVYRVCVQGWTKQEAIEEMTSGGYGFSSLWTHLVGFLRGLDVDRLRSEAGLVPGR